ncbi:hypothetical protein [Bacillus sp. ISL-39]|uniref:hypothetical protein n=1 Tax=Bacillus sp. ISL-39 TaxID=2819124 RepID=UPI001BE877E7|nr:hypothetical protein [Bacillus sp. ISL-39]MBT2639681.1 hypothetical protein [Bacillus sp. ISL-39]
MIIISRKYWGINVVNIYFPSNDQLLGAVQGIVGITQASKPLDGLNPLETLQIDLNKTEAELFADMKKSTKQQIKQAMKISHLVYNIASNPSDREIFEFRSFYNKFAAVKNTYRCRKFNLKTLQLLRDKNSLIISRIIDGEMQETLCYRVYVYEHNRVTPLYSVSHHLSADDPQRKRLLSLAHRYLKWKDMLWLKGAGCQLYDNGGLTNDPNIRKYKIEFGGTIITEYSGYTAGNLLGKTILALRKLLRKI